MPAPTLWRARMAPYSAPMARSILAIPKITAYANWCGSTDAEPQGISPRHIIMPLIVLVCGALVLYPIGFLINESLNVGDPSAFPPEEYGLDNYANLIDDYHVLANTALVACIATVLAVIFGFLQAWILTRTNIPGRQRLERLMELPDYMTPLIGALAWGVLLGPKTGLVNQAWRFFGAPGDLFNIYSPWGIAWVMALFEGTVAFVMISAAMKSMDPSLEESSRVLGAGKLRTALRVTLPLVAPGVLSATIFVFAEMLGSFAAAFVLGIPGRFYVVTTSIWQATLSFPPDYGRAAAMGLSLFAVMLITLTLARFVLRKGTYTTITGKAFRPRAMDVGALRWPLLAIAWGYIIVAVILPLGALLLTSFERFATVIIPQMQFTFANYTTAMQMGSVGPAFINSLLLGDLGLHHRRAGDRRAGLDHLSLAHAGQQCRGIRHHVSAGGAAPGIRPGPLVGVDQPADPDLRHAVAARARVFHRVPAAWPAHHRQRRAAGRPQAWRNAPVSVARSGCYQMRTVTMPLLRPGLVAAWLLIFIASRARTGRVDLPDGTQFQGDRTRHRQLLAELELRTVRRNGADPDRDHLHRRRRPVRRWRAASPEDGA